MYTEDEAPEPGELRKFALLTCVLVSLSAAGGTIINNEFKDSEALENSYRERVEKIIQTENRLYRDYVIVLPKGWGTEMRKGLAITRLLNDARLYKYMYSEKGWVGLNVKDFQKVTDTLPFTAPIF